MNTPASIQAAKALLIPGIPAAIARARRKDTPSCTDWPRIIGTTVYRLVEKLQES